jgi:thiamine pyrophosphate-dependent acetolactate synthase large subunit-like protein
VDTSSAVLAANYPASLAICARVEDVVRHIANANLARTQWSDRALAEFRARFDRERDEPIEHEPTLSFPQGTLLRDVFAAISGAFGENAVFTTDAGLHQALARRYADVTSPRGLLCPNDFQSMGFGLPGAIGAALARPGATIIACVGDGALALSMGEMLTAVREGIDLVVVVFNDESYGLIRRQQLLNFGHPADTLLHSPDYSALAAAVGCSYFPATPPLVAVMQTIARTPGVRLLELQLRDSATLGRAGLKSAVRQKLRRSLPDGAVNVIRRALGR